MLTDREKLKKHALRQIKILEKYMIDSLDFKYEEKKFCDFENRKIRQRIYSWQGFYDRVDILDDKEVIEAMKSVNEFYKLIGEEI